MQMFFYGLTIAILSQPFLSFSFTALSPLQLAQASEPNSSIVSVALPVEAQVWFNAKKGGSKIGQVMGFDAKQKALILGTSSIQFAEVDKVQFDRKSSFYNPKGDLVIRGEDKAKAKQSTWQNLPLSALQIKNAERGQAQVNLDGVMKLIYLKGIQSVAARSVYVVDEIEFQSAGKMTIKVTPIDR
jgi:hypothetical protein